jgi:hypothetical protein
MLEGRALFSNSHSEFFPSFLEEKILKLKIDFRLASFNLLLSPSLSVLDWSNESNR